MDPEEWETKKHYSFVRKDNIHTMEEVTAALQSATTESERTKLNEYANAIRKRDNTMMTALRTKFTSGSIYADYLSSTGTKTLGEAGKTQNIYAWKGKNILGKFLMQLRQQYTHTQYVSYNANTLHT